MKKDLAFTLAEVLITLGIIGIVASMTIPALVKNYQKQVYVTQLKKFYTQFNSALLMVANNTCQTPNSINCFSLDIDASKAIAEQFKKSKNCANTTTDICWAPFNQQVDGTGYSMDFNSGTTYKFISADGMSVNIQAAASCSDFTSPTDPSLPMYVSCGKVYVDVNGLKPPNIAGRDVFRWNITSNRTPLIVPDVTANGCTTKLYNDSGLSCSNNIVASGWEMNY